MYFSSARYWLSASGLLTLAPPRSSFRAPWIRSTVAPACAQRLAARSLLAGGRQQQVLGGDVVVLELLGLVLGPVEQLGEPLRQVLLAALDARAGAQLVLEAGADPVGWGADLLQQRAGQPLGLVEQGEQEVLDVDRLVVAAARLGLGAAEHLLGLHGEAVGSHDTKLRPGSHMASAPMPHHVMAGPSRLGAVRRGLAGHEAIHPGSTGPAPC